MLVVLAIIGLIAAVAITPVSATLAHMRLSDDVRTLAGALREAHEVALNQQRDVRLALDGKGGATLVASTGARWPLSDGSAIMIAGGEHTVIFHGDGTASGGMIRLIQGKLHAELDVDAATAAIRVAR